MSFHVALVIAMLRQLLADTRLRLLDCPRHSPTTTHLNRTDRFGSSAVIAEDIPTVPKFRYSTGTVTSFHQLR